MCGGDCNHAEYDFFSFQLSGCFIFIVEWFNQDRLHWDKNFIVYEVSDQDSSTVKKCQQIPASTAGVALKQRAICSAEGLWKRKTFVIIFPSYVK